MSSRRLRTSSWSALPCVVRVLSVAACSLMTSWQALHSSCAVANSVCKQELRLVEAMRVRGYRRRIRKNKRGVQAKQETWQLSIAGTCVCSRTAWRPTISALAATKEASEVSSFSKSSSLSIFRNLHSSLRALRADSHSII